MNDKHKYNNDVVGQVFDLLLATGEEFEDSGFTCAHLAPHSPHKYAHTHAGCCVFNACVWRDRLCSCNRQNKTK